MPEYTRQLNNADQTRDNEEFAKLHCGHFRSSDRIKPCTHINQKTPNGPDKTAMNITPEKPKIAWIMCAEPIGTGRLRRMIFGPSVAAAVDITITGEQSR
jgi:hypothetical protein